MNKLEKILLLLIALIYGATVLLIGANLFILIGAIVVSVLIRAVCRKLAKPRSLQEETLDQAGFTGLSLNSSPPKK